MKSVVVICNQGENDLGLLGDVFQSDEINTFVLNREEFQSWPSSFFADVVVHLGSSWSVYWPQVKANVEAEIEVMRFSVQQGIPTLGICFGAQLLSRAFGGMVQRSRKTEIGWHDVTATTDGECVGGRWMQWHYDSFTAPSGFDVLATNDAGIQAIRRGRALGVQFHPEANEAIVTGWMSGSGAVELAEAGVSPDELLEETRREVTRTRQATKALMEWFLEVVAPGPHVKGPNN